MAKGVWLVVCCVVITLRVITTRGARNAEFFHPVAERTGVKLEDPGRAAGPGNDPAGLLKDGKDVVALHGFQTGLPTKG